MEWTKSHIRVYFFPRSNIPEGDFGPLGKYPDPSTWGTPTTSFEGGCDFSAHVQQQRIIINTDFCGEWAGSVWAGSSCAASTKAESCEEFVKGNPEAFKNAYWSFKKLAVFR